MNIAVVLSSKLPAKLYGGTERVVWGLLKELKTLGHRLWLVAERGSVCPYAEVIPRRYDMPLRAHIPSEVELVHLHNFENLEDLTTPHITTIHGNSIPSNLDQHVVFVSRNHAERFGVDSYVHNGLDWEAYPTPKLSLERKGFHFLGKAAWRVKNLKGAIDLVHTIPRAQLNVLGGYRINFKMGFRITLSPRIRFFGMVDDLGKARIIQKSQGLVFPVRWHEPFGLAVIESLYYGSPVFGTPYGSLPELVGEEFGYLSTRRTDIAQRMIAHIEERLYSPYLCHEYARETFSARQMAQAYLLKYEAVLNGNALCKREPVALDAERSLPWDE